MLNRVILMGRLVADPERKQTSNGISVCAFRVAVNRPYSKEKEQQADFIDVVAWRQAADFVCKYFGKGQMIIVEGSIQTRTYEDKNGSKRKAVEVVASSVQFGESKKSAGQDAASAPPQAPAESDASGYFPDMDGDSDDLPF